MTAHAMDWASFGRIVGEEHLRRDDETLSRHAVDGVIPQAVAFPRDTDQVSALVRLACREKQAVLPWGGGSKMDMGHPPSRLDLVVCTARLDRIVDTDTANLTVTAQSGVRFRDIQRALAGQENRCYLPVDENGTGDPQPVCSEREHKGCFVPLWPGFTDRATVGGVVAANASGPTRLLYGVPRDLVLGVRFVAPDGQIVGMGGKTVKNVSGYDMSKLMIGSMGTLGVICEMTLRLLPLPERRSTVLFVLPGLEEACGLVRAVLDTPLLPAAIELMNHRALAALDTQVKGSDRDGVYAVAVALEGFHEAVDRMGGEMRSLAGRRGLLGEGLLDEARHIQFWDLYSNMAFLPGVNRPGRVSFKVTYPISRFQEILELAEALSGQEDVECVLTSHAGSGITRVHLPVERRDAATEKGVCRVAGGLLERCAAIGGNLVVESAQPELKKQLAVWGLPRADQAIMQRIKQEMDPLGLFSAGRFAGGI